MGFKVDTSFLRFLTMGALGVQRVAAEFRARGFEPIDLERYCDSNKIWATKVKRLRMPDLLCIRTGLRIEVRAKRNLQIRMSDAPNNPERTWDAGCRDEDIVALIACADGPDGPVPADGAMCFTVQALRESVAQSKLGLPKSASEGAETRPDLAGHDPAPPWNGIVCQSRKNRRDDERRWQGFPETDLYA